MKARAVVLLGAPGAGKGTQARELSRRLSIPQISTGDILRDAVRRQTLLGLQAKAKMEAGELVPDEVVCGIVEERISQPDNEKGFILDGFPRTLAQAEFLARVLRARGQGEPQVLNLGVDRDILLKRLTGRRICTTCGEIYNIYLNPPRQDEVCDKDGTKLLRRADDNEESIRHRLAAYENETQPLIDYYRRQNLLREVDGSRPPEAVSRDVVSSLRRA